MSQNALAQLVVKILVGLLSWVRSLPPTRRIALYTAGALLAVAFLVVDHFVPGWRAFAKHLWVSYGPFLLLVVGGLATAHVSFTKRPSPESDLDSDEG